ncbi:MAG: serine/threonine protein kinase [Sandaracinaceae bacterium]|nr:serine/threonine protein kinase [Sandaracinaceae bacterium]
MGEGALREEGRRFFGPGAREGEVIAGRYRVVREIGAGGMGQVVEVEHLELEKRFALKLIRPDRWDTTLEARFRREAKALARVVSPRVAQVTDFGVDPDRGPFYVMEYVDGEPLDALIRREGALPRERALTLAIGIAEALCDVHEAGIVHRDVKPGNIGVCGRGPVEVRLLDFGLATSVDERFGSKITDSRRVVGSFPYMAPEQFQGDAPSPRMDVWALGIVLYEMLTGRLPFDAPSTAALIHQILSSHVPLSDPAPRTCTRVFDRLLAKDASARPAGASQALEVLEEALLSQPTDERECLPAPSSARGSAARTAPHAAARPAEAAFAPPGALVSAGTVEATRVDTGPSGVHAAPLAPMRARRWAIATVIVLAGLGVAVAAGLLIGRAPAPGVPRPAEPEVARAPLPEPSEPAVPTAQPPPAPLPIVPEPVLPSRRPRRAAAVSSRANEAAREPSPPPSAAPSAAPSTEPNAEPSAEPWNGTIIETPQ